MQDTELNTFFEQNEDFDILSFNFQDKKAIDNLNFANSERSLIL